MPNETVIHPTAIVDPTAQLDAGVRVGAYAMVEAGARIGADTNIGHHATIGTETVVGRRNRIHPYAVLGTDSQDYKFEGETAGLVVGDDNTFREFVTVNRATGEGLATRIGNGCRFIAYAHVAHNCVVEDGVVMVNAAQLGGEVVVEKNAIVGGLVGIHQFCRIGAHAFIGACSKVTQDIVPYVKADGHPARPWCINVIGLERHGFDADTIARLKQAYRLLFVKGHTLQAAVQTIETELSHDERVRHLLDFVGDSERSIARPRGDEAEASA